ncbi:DNA ligase (ATP) [Tulasnella sp. 418]|nr:DNA ligase (ATP) [Tulasnella sp. 418]
MPLPTPQPSPSKHTSESLMDSIPDEYVGEPELQRPPGVLNTKPSPPFDRITSLFEATKDVKPNVRKDRLSVWFDRWREHVGNDLYPAMRLILPHKDRERATYGVKEAGIAKAYIAALGLDKHSKDAIRLIKWKTPTADNPTAGDFPSVVYDVIKARSTVEVGQLSVDEVNEYLDKLSKSGKEVEASKVFTHFYDTCTPEEQRWIIRIILKDLGISIRENSVLPVFHPEAMDMFNTCSDLKRVCWLLPTHDKHASSKEKKIQLFQSFQPMLCKRGKTIKDTVRAMGRQFIMEEKLDGERIQLHKRGHQFFYCSRKGKDYTYLYGMHVGEGSLTPFIQDAFDPRVKDIILDGEMVVWDPELQKYCNFGNLKSAAIDIKSGGENGPRPCFKVFDMLYLKSSAGKETHMTEMPLENRKKTMRALIKEIPGRFECLIHQEGKNLADVEKLLKEVVEQRGEGLVLKSPSSRYILGGRESSWMKVKPDYMDDLGESVDVLVIGGQYGSGSRGGKVSNLVCAVMDDSSTASKNIKRYMSFLRVGSGLTFADYEWIKSRNWKPYEKSRTPDWMRLSTASSIDDTGHVYIEPEDSFVVSVKGASINSTEGYACQMTLRFPRCLGIRHDLSLDDVLTYSDLFTDMVFLIFNDRRAKPPYDKSSIEKLIVEHGGDFTQAFTQRTAEDRLYIYGGKAITPPIKKVIEADEQDILKPQYILDCVKEGDLIHPSSKYYFHATTARKRAGDFEAEEEAEEEEEESKEALAGSPMEEDEEELEKPSKSQTHDGEASATEDEEDVPQSQLDPWLQRQTQQDESTSKRLAAINIEDDTDTEEERPLRSVVRRHDDGSEEDEEDEDEWESKVKSMALGKGKLDQGLLRRMSQVSVNPKSGEGDSMSEEVMGESEDDMQYDDAKLFRHLCFYLDSPANARALGMEVKLSGKLEESVSSDFAKIHLKIIENGGRVISSLDDPKLTHLVVHERDKTRRIELMTRTSQPKRRHLVVPAFIEDSLSEETLLNEDVYEP